MINKIKNKLSVKIFFTSFLLFIFVSMGTFLLVSKLIPNVYTDVLNENLNTLINETLMSFEKEEKIADCIQQLNELNFEKDTQYWIYDSNGNMVYSSNDTMKKLENYEDYLNNESKIDTSQTFSQYPFSLSNEEQYTISVEADLNEVRAIKDILLTILPYILLLDFIISFLCSLFYANYIAKPILYLCDASKEMAKFKFDYHQTLKRDDEIGILSINLHFLAQSLQTKMTELNTINSQLKSDIAQKRELEHSRMAFFAATSHELKTPITILKGHLNGMIDQVGNYSDRDTYLKRSLAATEQMERLIRELLYIAKLDDTKTIHLKEEDFAELVRLEISNTITLFDEKELVLAIDVPEHLVCLLDKEIIHTILQNLIMNAIQYTPIQGTITIQLYRTEKNVCFIIENTGAHIPVESLDKIFDAFYKVDNSRSDGGTGLGLYIVRELLDKHHANYKMMNLDDCVRFECLFNIAPVDK